jgi:TolA-binding protein
MNLNRRNTKHTTWCRWGGCALLGWSIALSAGAQIPAFSTYTPATALMVGAENAEEGALERALEAAHRDEPGSEVLLRGFLEAYPESTHAADVRLELATLHLVHGETATALEELNQIEPRELPADRQHLLFFRKGQALIESGRYADARPYYLALEQAGDPDYQTEASYYVAYLDYEQGNYDEALQRFGNLPFTEKYATSAPYYITQILYRQGKWDDAERQAQRLLGAGRSTMEQRAELNRIVGECALRKGNTNEARQYLTTYLSETAEAQVMPIASSAYNCGVLAAEAGDNQLAIDALSRAASSGMTTDATTASRAYLLLGQTYLNSGQALNARLAFERAASTTGDPEAQEAAAYNYAVMVHQTQCSPFDEEITVFEDFLNKYPNSQYADKASEYLTEVYLTTRNYETALASLDRIKKPTSTLQAARQRLLYRLGIQNYVNGDLTTATTNFTDAINLGALHAGTLAEAHFWRGESYYTQEEYKKAEADFRSFNQLKPTGEASHLAAGYYNLGYALFKQGRYSEAISPLAEYVARPSERGTAQYSDALARIGDCYYYTRNFSKAEEYYSASASSNETNTADYAIFQKAFMAGLQKKYSAKLDGLELLIRNYSESEWVDDAYLERGKTYLLLGNNEAAIKAFKEVVTHYYNKQCAPEAGLQLALVYYNSGRTADAIAAYKDVIAMHPGSDEAQTALEDLKNIYVEQGEVATYANYLSTLDGKVPMSAGEQDSLTYVSATRLLAKGKTTEAETAMEKYLATYPSGRYAIDANIQLARAYRSSGRLDQALKRYDAVADMTGGNYTNEALLAIAEIYDEQGKTAKAFDAYQQLVVRTDETEYRRSGLMGSTRTAAQLGKDDEVVLNFTELNKDANLPAATRQEGQLLRAKALLHMGETGYALEDLRAAAGDMRTTYGAEAKYTMAQTYFDKGQTAEAEAQVMELINSGTPHQYWLARGFILLADVALNRDDTFQAKQYLQSLQSNYSGNVEINQMIEERLAKCK